VEKFWTWMVEKKYMEEENEVYFFDLETVKVVHHNLDKDKFKKQMLIGYMIEFLQEKLAGDPTLEKKLGKIDLKHINFQKLSWVIEHQIDA